MHKYLQVSILLIAFLFQKSQKCFVFLIATLLFSPLLFERENPLFKEAVKIAITPMISSLSILNYVDMDSEESVLGYGIGLILLNLGMYFVAPAIIIHRIRK